MAPGNVPKANAVQRFEVPKALDVEVQTMKSFHSPWRTLQTRWHPVMHLITSSFLSSWAIAFLVSGMDLCMMNQCISMGPSVLLNGCV